MKVGERDVLDFFQPDMTCPYFYKGEKILLLEIIAPVRHYDVSAEGVFLVFDNKKGVQFQKVRMPLDWFYSDDYVKIC
jgi:hypothetical protein